ncbi:glucuronosyltransferase [Brevundimonas nasdae]|uniref:glucuronosyltransferase n=1 Tax=Brevundimonas nasdae TaxID=172043 RepID=UPI003F68D6A5
MMLIRGAFEGYDVVYANPIPGLAELHGLDGAVRIPDFSLQSPLRALKGAFSVAWVVLATRPKVAISTGAAPGVFALLFARLCGAKTIWLDSVANAEKLSLSGRLAGLFVDVWLTQWQHVAASSRHLRYEGSVL